VEKTYLVFLDKVFEVADIERLKKGMEIEGKKTSSVKVRYASSEKKVIEVTLHEGRNRIVRRMMEELGYKVMRLVRTKVGTVDIGNLQPGKFRKMSYQEVRQFLR
jgi:pseudouridine synthase